MAVQMPRKILVAGCGPWYRGAGRRSVLAHGAPLCDFGTCWYGHCRALSTQSAHTRGDTPAVPPVGEGIHGGYPPANCGRTSMTAASGRITSGAASRLAAAPSTRKEDAASTA